MAVLVLDKRGINQWELLERWLSQVFGIRKSKWQALWVFKLDVFVIIW